MKESNASALSMWIKCNQTHRNHHRKPRSRPTDNADVPRAVRALSFSSAPQPPVRHVPAAAGTAARGMIANVRMELHERDTSGTSPDIGLSRRV